MKTLTTTLLTVVLLINLAPPAWAKQKGDWNLVKVLVSRSIAVKTTTGETHYGLLQSADDTSITVQIAGADDFTSQEVAFRRSEVQRVWRAKLRFGEKNIAKGALIGLGAGIGVGVISASILAARGSSDPPTGVGLYPIFGAGGGALLGNFWKKKHKKEALIYSI